MLCLIVFFTLRRKESSRKYFLLVSIVLITLSVSWFGWEPIVERFGKAFTEEGELTDGRFLIWEDSAGIVRDFPLAGTGFGTFENIYPTYRTLLGDRGVGHAHNDYLELVSNGGLVGFALVGWFLVVLIQTTWGRYKKRRDSYAHCLYLGALAGLLAIFFHSVVDFNFYNNANGLIFFFVCGLAVSASHTRLRGRKPTFLEESNLPFRKVTASVVAIFLVIVSVYQGGTLWAGSLYSSVKDVELSSLTPAEELSGFQTAIKKASVLDPLSPIYPLDLAHYFAFTGDALKAEALYLRAVRLNPVDAEALYVMGRHLCNHGRVAEGEPLLELAMLRDTSNPEYCKYYAGWLFGRGAMAEGGRYLKRAMTLTQRRDDVKECIALMLYHGMDKEEILELMPDRVSPRFALADTMAALGDTDFSRDVIVGSLDYINQEENITPWLFTKVYWVYMKEHNYDMALSVLQKAARYLSDNAVIHTLSGDTYLKMGIHYRAVEEYKQALIIDPDNSKVKKKLERLLST